MESSPTPNTPTTPTAPAWRGRLRLATQYAILAAFAWAGARELGLLPSLKHDWALAAGAGMLLGFTRARTLLWIAAGFVLSLLLIVGYTPLVPYLAKGLQRTDPLEPAPAVVVLGTWIFPDQSLTSSAQERFAHGYEILGQGYAPRLIITHCPPPGGPWEDRIRRQMADMKLNYPVDVVGPVKNTHDEALAVAELAKTRGWDRVILVTHPWHMRRAAAVFEKAGIRVICSPAAEGRYDWTNLSGPRDRIGIFSYWVHEAGGMWVYRRRGWID